MGMGFCRTCSTNSERRSDGVPVAVPPNPSPSRWTYLDHVQYTEAYALKVRYHDCTNYEGVKVMVYRGQWRDKMRTYLDPHFAETDDAPIARFRPDATGWKLACVLAMSLGL